MKRTNVVKNKKRTLIFIAVSVLLILAIGIFVFVLSNRESDYPFEDITEKKINNVFVYRVNSDAKYVLSHDEINELLAIIKDIHIDRDTRMEMQSYFGNVPMFYIELKDGKNITVGSVVGREDYDEAKYIINKQEYDGDQENCKEIEELFRRLAE